MEMIFLSNNKERQAAKCAQKNLNRGGDAFSPGEHPHLFQTWEAAIPNSPGFLKGKLIMKIKSKLIIAATLTFCVVATLSRAVCTQTCEEVNVPVFAENSSWG